MKHRQLSLRRLGAALLALCALAADPGPALAVTQIDPAETISTSSVSLIRGQSCKTDAYYSVTRVKVGDGSVAAASADSAGRVIITALAAGQTTVTYYSMSDYTTSWVYHAVNVTVDGGRLRPQHRTEILHQELHGHSWQNLPHWQRRPQWRLHRRRRSALAELRREYPRCRTGYRPVYRPVPRHGPPHRRHNRRKLLHRYHHLRARIT